MAPSDLTRQKLIEYFLDAAKPKSQWLVGMEIEKLGRETASGRPIPYSGSPASVRQVLETYHALRGGDPIYESEYLIGVAGPWGTISLEPGGQVEWSSPPCADLDELARELDEHLATVAEAGRRCGITWLDVAVDPDHAVEEMPWMPKARYKIMGAYLGAHGRLAHRMMTQTTSIQCAFDFENAEDWSRKFLAAALAAPVCVALFANSSRADGRETGYRSFRQRIWRETDPDRCGLPAIVFAPGFGIEAWVDWLLQVPTIFCRKARGLVASNGVPFFDCLDRRGRAAVALENWELHLSTIFTEVRAYGYIEVRSADLQPDDRVLSVPALYTGLLYHPVGPDFIRNVCAGHATHAAWLAAMESAARHGLDGEAGGRPLRQLASAILGAAAHGLRHGAACSGRAPDPAQPLVDLARAQGVKISGNEK